MKSPKFEDEAVLEVLKRSWGSTPKFGDEAVFEVLKSRLEVWGVDEGQPHWAITLRR
jgi:hypothetical protein